MGRWWALVAALCLVCGGLAACGGPAAGDRGTATALAVAVATALAPPPTRPAPTPTAPARVGQTAAIAPYALTLTAVTDPTAGEVPAPAGMRLVAFDVTIRAKVDGLPYNPIYAKLRLADNTEGQPWLTGKTPALQVGKLANQEQVRGWVTFAIPASARPATFVYEPLVTGYGSMRVDFDLR